jgi:SOS-response transcriptional repressor LexA
MYSPVFVISHKGFWIVGKVEENYGISLTEKEVQEACDLLNSKKVVRDKPTKKTIETEKFIDDYIAENGYPPTFREIGKHFGISSGAVVQKRVRFCRHKLITRNSVEKKLKI